MRVLVVGDQIFDHYVFCHATRLCPEGPAPVLKIQSERTTQGGAALIAENLKSLIGKDNVLTAYGSVSNKRRIFADRTLLCRIDQDRYSVKDQDAFWKEVLGMSKLCSVIVVGDYGKGAMSRNIATGLAALQKPLFVDAKSDPTLYTGCYALFPNENEHNNLKQENFRHIVRKLGPQGCSVDGELIPTEPQQVYDVTGAGDVFMAAFVAKYLELQNTPPGPSNFGEMEMLRTCASYANIAAGISVRHLGTYIISPEELP